ncbi:MAG TPA: hypothetical protein ENJ00_02800 [Phycisphaerales bacterium]|nr:hypothetical protein [Phycisphaerales bacterium]
MIAPPSHLQFPVLLWLIAPLPALLMPMPANLLLPLIVIAIEIGIIIFLRRPAPLMLDHTREALLTSLALLLLPMSMMLTIASLVVVIYLPAEQYLPGLLVIASADVLILGSLRYAQALDRSRAHWYTMHCPTCCYDITSCEVPICPECGRPITSAPDPAN